MEAITFRDATVEDLPAIVAIYNLTVPTRMVTADLEPVSVESKVEWFHKHNSINRPLWVVEDAEKTICGWVSFQSFYGRPAYNATVEISIYLHSETRGKGLGKTILQYCIEKAPFLAIKTLIGFIFLHNTPSIKLFTSLGFSEWGTLPDVADLDGEERSVKIFGKRVSK